MAEPITRLELLTPDIRDRDVEVKITHGKVIKVKFVRLGHVADKLIQDAQEAFIEKHRTALVEKAEADLSVIKPLSEIESARKEFGFMSVEELRQNCANVDRLYYDVGVEEDAESPLPKPEDYEGKSEEELVDYLMHELLVNTLLTIDEFAIRQTWPDYLDGMSEEERKKATQEEIGTRREAVIREEIKNRRSQIHELPSRQIQRRLILNFAQNTAVNESDEVFTAIKLWDSTRSIENREQKFFHGEGFPETLTQALENAEKTRDSFLKAIHDDYVLFELLAREYIQFLRPLTEVEVQATAEDNFRRQPLRVLKGDGSSSSIQ